MSKERRAMNKKQTADKYMKLCNLFEALWLKRNDTDYYDIDLDNLPPLTSPQARRLATFVFELMGKQR
jgi:hypothetical protein